MESHKDKKGPSLYLIYTYNILNNNLPKNLNEKLIFCRQNTFKWWKNYIEQIKTVQRNRQITLSTKLTNNINKSTNE